MSIRKILCVISLWFPILSFAIPMRGFSHITVNDGLSRNSIYSLLQDSVGFVYIGTWDALHRYDGNEIRELIFTPTATNPTRIVTALAEGKNGKIYVGTSRGVIIWDTRSETSSEFSNTFNPSVTQMLSDTNGNIHILDTDGAHHIINSSTDSISHITGKTQYLVKSSGGEIIPLTQGLLPDKKIIAAMSGPGDELWVSTDHDGVYHRPGGAIELRELKFNQTPTPRIVKFTRFGSAIIMASERGLWIYDPNQNEISHIKANTDDPTGLNDMKVIELMTDREGGLWVGTFFGGINYMSPTKGNFTTFSDVNKGIDGHVVSAIATDIHGNIWFGVEDGGISQYNPTQHTIENFNSRNRSSMSPSVDNVQGLYSQGDTLYVGMAWGGMDMYLISEKRKIAHYPPSQTAPDFPPSVYAFIKGADGAIYIGTMSGMFRYQQGTGDIVRITEIPKVIIHSLVSDKNGQLWAASQGGGIYRHDGKKWSALSKSHDIQMAMSVLPTDSIIYIGTEGHGLYGYNTESKQISPISLGLTGRTMVFSITTDGNNLWLTTNRGLVAYNPTSGQALRFTTHDGLQSNQFKINSALRLIDGTIITGSVNGINAFKPDELLLNLTKPSPILVECIIQGENPDTIPSSRATELALPCGNSGFTLRFASSSYDDISKNRFEYKLDGYDNNWQIASEGTTSVTYPTLKQGTYIFRLRTANGNGVFGEETELKIIAPTPSGSIDYTLIIIVVTIFILATTAIAIVYRKNKQHEKTTSSITLTYSTDDNKSDSDNFITKLNQIIIQEIDNTDLSVDDLAYKIGMGRSIFYRKVKTHTGQTPNEYLRTVRLNRAAELLRRPGARVNQVCYQTGFSSPSYFSRCFTSMFGTSPSDYATREHE